MRKVKQLLLLFAFILFLVSGVYASQDVVIRVGNRNVTDDQYQYNYKRYNDSYKAYYGVLYDDSIKEKMEVALMEDLVESEIYMDEAENRGIVAKIYITEEEIEERIMRNPIFFVDGKFNADKYNAAKVSPEVNWSDLRKKANDFLTYERKRSIIPSKVRKALKDEISVEDDEILTEYSKNNELMKVKYIPIDYMKYADSLKVTNSLMSKYLNDNRDYFAMDKAAKYKVLYFNPKNYMDMVFVSEPMKKGYYEKYKNEFTAPRRAKIDFVLFRYKDFSDLVYKLGINPREYYEENIDQFVEPAKIKVRYIYVKYDKNDARSMELAEIKLKNLVSDLNYGISFLSLAKRYSDDEATASFGGDLGYIEKGRLNEPFDSAIFSLNNGDISGIFKTDRGYYIMKVEDKKPERVKFFTEVKDDIEQGLLYEAAKPYAMLEAKRFAIEAKKDGFSEYAKKKYKKVYKTEYFKAGDRIPLIGKSLNFEETVFSMNSGEVSDVIEYDHGYAVFQVSDITTIEYLPYEKASSRIRDAISMRNSRIFAKKDAEHTKNRLLEGVSVEAIEEMNIKIKGYVSNWIDGDKIKLNSIGFEYTKGEELYKLGDISEVIEGENGYYMVAVVQEREPHLPEIQTISREVAVGVVKDYGEKKASAEAETILKELKSGKTLEKAAEERGLKVKEVGPFGKRDYIIDGRYMVDLINDSFSLKEGDISIVRNLTNYCVAKVVWRGIDEKAFNENKSIIKAEILRAKRKEYVDNWLKKKKEATKVVVSMN